MAGDNKFRPIILVRGFDPLGDVANSTYYGFNDGSVYPQKFGEDYIYEGMLLKFLKTPLPMKQDDGTLTHVSYQDATNVLRYSPFVSADQPCVAKDENIARQYEGKSNTLWVYRYYDFHKRDVVFYAQQLQKVIEIVEQVSGVTGVNLVCHSMGGLIARHLIQNLYATQAQAEAHVNKWITLGTPHRGIAFDIFPQLDLWELEYFSQAKLKSLFGDNYADVAPVFDPARILCIVGTNYRAYNVAIATKLNQFASWLTLQDQNHSDGLVKQTSATLIGANRADVFKCHGGADSLMTSREAFELATRFFFGDVRISVYVETAEVRKGFAGSGLLARVATALDGDPEFYVGFSVKPRKLDFDLHRQDKESENCFGPIHTYQMTAADFRLDSQANDATQDGLVYRGFLNRLLIPAGRDDLAFRFATYVGERDALLLGHSDTEIVNAQSYFQYVSGPPDSLLFYPDKSANPIACAPTGKAGEYRLALDFGVLNPNFRMTLRIRMELI